MGIDIQWLEENVFRRKLSDDESAALSCLTVHRYDQGAAILTEGEAGRGMYILRSGTIDITVIYEEEPVRLSQDREGALFSKLSLLEPESKSAAHVVASDHCTVYKLSHPAFLELLHRQQSLALLFLFAALSYQERIVQQQNRRLLPYLYQITKTANSLPLAIKLFPLIFILLFLLAMILIPTKY